MNEQEIANLIKTLRAKRDRFSAALAGLEKLLPTRTVPAAQRLVQSKKMKAYWAKKRKE